MSFARYIGECGVLFFLIGFVFGIVVAPVLAMATVSVRNAGGGMRSAKLLRYVALIVKASSYWMLCTLIALAASSHGGNSGVTYWMLTIVGALLFLFINFEGVNKAERQARKAEEEMLAAQAIPQVIADVMRQNTLRFWFVEYTAVVVAMLYLITMAWLPWLTDISWLVAIWKWVQGLFSFGGWLSVPLYLLGWFVCLKGLLAICLGIGALPFLALQKKAGIQPECRRKC